MFLVVFPKIVQTELDDLNYYLYELHQFWLCLYPPVFLGAWYSPGNTGYGLQ